MRYAIVSDIHSNRQAWKTVRGDIRAQGVDMAICLGDIVGYGPMPEEVLESVCDEVNEIVIGNHDAVIGGRLEQDIFSEEAQRYIDWTRDALDESAVDFFADLPSVIEGDSFVMAHAEVFDPERYGYIEQISEAQENFDVFQKPVLFVGHTHCPAIYEINDQTGAIRTLPPRDFFFQPGLRYIVNVGSVGDPRDDDPLASYCVFDEDMQRVVFRRLDFDMAAYKADLAARQVKFNPWFLSRLTPGVAGAPAPTPGRDWAIQIRLPPKPREEDPGSFNRVRLGSNLNEQEQAEAAEAHARREQMAKALREATLQAELRRQQRAEAAKDLLRRRQEAAEEIRRQQEAERLAAEIDARERKVQLALSAAQRRQERDARRRAEAQMLADRLRAKQQAALEARLKKEEEERVAREAALLARRQKEEEVRLAREAAAQAARAAARQAAQLAALPAELASTPQPTEVPPMSTETERPRIQLIAADDEPEVEVPEAAVAEVAAEAAPLQAIPIQPVPVQPLAPQPEPEPTDPVERAKFRKAQLAKAAEEKHRQRMAQKKAVEDARKERIRKAIQMKKEAAQKGAL